MIAQLGRAPFAVPSIEGPNVTAMSLPYMASARNVPDILSAIREASVPERFTHEFLKRLGFNSSNDRGVIPVLKALRFLDDNGVPTDRYKAFRDESLGGAIMAEALRDAYSDLFAVAENANELPPAQLKSSLKRVSGKGDSAAEKMTATFKAFDQAADWSAPLAEPESATSGEESEAPSSTPETAGQGPATISMRHDIHVHLPTSTDVKVYDAIFRSLREHFG